ncbi:Uncharacterized protein BM_BM1027 [Brugia malayi]|uniref:Bm1027 n=1 Tax=Brugia malayi TaxID=6279 RepID=A0A0K0IMN7_BRUMA|nr:Uncharacterized protein BM_BM1027 [Brugia malayi]CDQ02244.1 Bm1027 [Brugia malayi]VIO96310.1 Uncharacterized protein BM_BM1027 [Brugia malayi]
MMRREQKIMNLKNIFLNHLQFEFKCRRCQGRTYCICKKS